MIEGDKAAWNGPLFSWGRRLPGGPLHLTAAEQVDVKVVDGLASGAPGVDDAAKAAVGKPFPLGYLPGDHQQVAEQVPAFLAGSLNARQGLLGNYEDVNGCLRIDVAKGETKPVFVDDVRGNFPADDFAEYGFGTHSFHLKNPGNIC